MLGYCGINCDTCPAYQGTVTRNRDLLTQAADGDSTQATDWVCLGCTPANQAFLSTYCGGCEVRTCAVDKDVQNCAACADYEECSTIKCFLGTEPNEVNERMAWLRARFLARAGGST